MGIGLLESVRRMGSAEADAAGGRGRARHVDFTVSNNTKLPANAEKKMSANAPMISSNNRKRTDFGRMPVCPWFRLVERSDIGHVRAENLCV